MNVRHKLFLSLLSILTFTLSSPISLALWRFHDGNLKQIPHAQIYKTVRPLYSADLDNNGISDFLRVDQGIATLYSAPESSAGFSQNSTPEILLWQSPEDWNIRQALIADLNHDKRLEIVLLVNREFQPWPIDRYLLHPGRINDFHDSENQSCHIILIGWRNGKFQEVWAGSAMASPFDRIITADIDEDGITELIASESSYSRERKLPAVALTIWKWNGFGFSIVTRTEHETRQLFLIRDDTNHYYLLSD